MTPETWTVMLAAAAFLLLGIAVSPLACVALWHRRFRFEQQIERRWRETLERLSALEAWLEQIDRISSNATVSEKQPGDSSLPRGPHWPRVVPARPDRVESVRADASAPTLIAVPSLAAPPSEREASINGISARYAAIWSLADSGASADVIARAMGQPIGQIELILGLRRQIDASRTNVAHGFST